MHNPFAALQYPKFKLAILVLLMLNTVIYAFVDTLTSTVDALAWLILLVMYELETNSNNLPIAETIMQAIRYGLIALIALVFVSYLQDSEWLDVVNSLLWFGLIAMLELEVHKPGLVMRHGQFFWLLTVATFIGLVVMAVIWLWQGAWLDGYDAALWIVAFGLIEVDIFNFLKRKTLNN
ncbi:MAG: hypothetical protein Q8N35_07420 [Methylococcaceae bacterium]|nr:hypothetical protein [Methylococcaceae bacterium]MDZ4155441.1 hypothetical protein [Methylococcales bacterium]MDP2394303.1 hypothetical protein [Methylococcaceae bacterium]MDP3019398.1 hypothetical protein [Methylococcaceae bacterium]MDP3390652.1 hypothetical protein [Methylococcaceae bacterium]